jgi:hypothetical protein
MASLIPGYDCDLFISYRQKDNKHVSCVIEFIDDPKAKYQAENERVRKWLEEQGIL